MSRALDAKRIIMNFSVPPGLEELEAIAAHMMEAMPDEILEFCEDLTVAVEDFPDETVESTLELDDPYNLLALYKSGKEISPGVERKTAKAEDVLVIYRRPLLDMWCEAGEDLGLLIRQVMIEELGRRFDFTDDEIEEMLERHYQGLL
ncbi:MAG: metallopeptidase family protein [Alphaproteobacteria bacterium]|nr:metallopeptidase family protein [Alphaproteobacteria bacterium]